VKGVYTALITPFLKDGSIDFDSFSKILRDQADAGISGVIPCGTTGESPTLSIEEKQQLIQTTLKELRGTGVKTIAGTGSNNTAETITLSKWASDEGADGVLIVTPYYNKPSQLGLEQHFKSVADAVKCEVMLYNVPGRTGISLSPETIVKLAMHPKIRSLKEATGNLAFTSEVFDQLLQGGGKLDVLSGDDATYLPMLAIGATGVVSVASNLFPRAMVALQKSVEGNDLAQAREIQARYYPLFRDLFIDSNPVPIKAAMAYVGWCEIHVRAPLLPLSLALQQKLESSLKRCGISPGRNAL